MAMKSNDSKIFLVGILLAINTSASVLSAAPLSVQSFESPEAGASQLFDAVKAEDMTRLRAIFGPPAESILDSGDSVQDSNARRTFVKLYNEKNKLVQGGDGRVTLLLGKEEWPFPVPLVSDGSKWAFDGEEGVEEIVNRRIGRNELSAIDFSKTYVNAQRAYFSRDRDGDGYREYAQVFVSAPGKKNGLFWPRRKGDGISPLGLVAIEAWAEGYLHGTTAQPAPYHGYFFKILTSQGSHAPGGAKSYIAGGGRMTEGFAMVAYPAEWGDSGIMTFIVSQDGTVFQRNLGPNSARIASALKEFNPEPGWEKIS